MLKEVNREMCITSLFKAGFDDNDDLSKNNRLDLYVTYSNLSHITIMCNFKSGCVLRLPLSCFELLPITMN